MKEQQCVHWTIDYWCQAEDLDKANIIGESTTFFTSICINIKYICTRRRFSFVPASCSDVFPRRMRRRTARTANGHCEEARRPDRSRVRVLHIQTEARLPQHSRRLRGRCVRQGDRGCARAHSRLPLEELQVIAKTRHLLDWVS